jgi:uncharacterized SAM-binding protein YcdF (DUF218 family)
MSDPQSVATDRPVRVHWMRWLVVLLLFTAVGWFVWVYGQIVSTANIDNAQPADAIAVFGAAEYAGRPSPVLHARLDKAVSLSGKTEGGVGRDYLLANGVPYDRMIAETKSIDTEQQVSRLADIASHQHFHHVIVVSDGTHLFRITLLCRRAGLDVYTSPRAPLGHIDELDAAQRIIHEMLSYTALRFDLHVSRLHRWLHRRSD